MPGPTGSLRNSFLVVGLALSAAWPPPLFAGLPAVRAADQIALETSTSGLRATARPADSFVQRAGQTLTLAGQPFRFTGFNIYNANSRDNCWYPLGYRDGALDADLSAIGNGQEVFRAWFYQYLATRDGRRDWSAFDQTLSLARSHGMRLIVTLADQWGSCDSGPGGATFKGEAWYLSGYRTEVTAGDLRTYRDWVAEIVKRYRKDPTILAWQLMNEAEIRPSLSSGCSPNGSAILRTWAGDVAGVIKSLDPNHLVSLGTLGGGQCGTQYTEYGWVHDLRAIDLCEVHDYDAGAMPGDQWNGMAFRLQQCAALGKPLFVGEVGVKDVSVATRAAVLEDKFRAQFAAGVVGALVWAFRDEAHGGSSATDYDAGPADPLVQLFTRY